MLIEPARDGGRVRSFALVASAATTVLAAGGFDLLAAEPPVHSMTLALVAVAVVVGVGRCRAQGRLPGLFALVNLVIVAQPAVHTLNKMLHAGADALPHGQGSVEGLSGVAVHVLIALLVLAVAASEPMYGFIATTLLRALAVVADEPSPAMTQAARPGRIADPHVLWWRVLQRCDGRRGPPTGCGLGRSTRLLSPAFS